jgi:translation initiation factor 2B subunit (eIF-2B alpha/beta/delta family)
MDRLLRGQLHAIGRDRTSGAAELARRGVAALQAWLRRRPQTTRNELCEIARALLHAQPSMAPLWRLANEVALAVDTRNAAKTLTASLARFRAVLRTAPGQIEKYFRRTLRRSHVQTILTYSYSSTVARALAHARSRIRMVYCAEGRPGHEGRAMASNLARAGIRVCLRTDAALFSLASIVPHGGLVVLGADKILAGGFENKIGTEVLVECARRNRRGMAVCVLADTTKFWPLPLPSPHVRLGKPRGGPPTEILNDAPRKVRIENPYFCFMRFFPRIRILTERGWTTPARVRRELMKIRISPRLSALAD